MVTRSSTGHRVFVAGLSHHNYEAAKAFGDLVIVVSGNVDLDDIEEIKKTIHTTMQHAEETDWVLLSGAPIICILCILFMLSRFDHVNVLQWNGVLRDYIPLQLKGAS